MINLGPFLTPLEAAHACVEAGEAINIWTPGWVAYETAKETMKEISDLYPGRTIRFMAEANRLECGLVPPL